ncbi:hypothetical protein [Mucilaginibacter sp.]
MELNNSTKKQYQQPEIKDLGKIGEVTNTNSTFTGNGVDTGSNSPNMYAS